jgi:hypothetical protein
MIIVSDSSLRKPLHVCDGFSACDVASDVRNGLNLLYAKSKNRIH